MNSLQQVLALQRIVSPYFAKSYQYDLETMYGQLNQIDLEVKMTSAQRMVYKEIYKIYSNVITKLGTAASRESLSSTDKLQLL